MSAEAAIRADPDWQEGMAHRTGGHGHPENSVGEHVEEVLANVDRLGAEGARREQLRLIALLHDAMKHRVRAWLPGRRDHARLARRFAERHIDDPAVLGVVERHDDAYRAWRFGQRTGLWFVAGWRARRLVRDLGNDLGLFLDFYRCDNETGDKAPDDRRWFENLYRERG